MTLAHTTSAFIFMLAFFPSQHLATDVDSLLNFKSTVLDPSNRLVSWTNGSSFCDWAGVSCSNASLPGRVNRLVLEDFGLGGSASSLRFVALLTDLRVLSLKNNVFSGEIPAAELAGLYSLKLLFLSHNNFSGSFPTQLLSLPRLYRLDLSFNLISGPLPIDAVNSMSHLLTLRLEDNYISGSISAIQITSLQDFNVSSNMLSGVIPVSLSGFPRSAFELNSDLCGYPLDRPCGARGNITSSPSSLPMGMENQDLKQPKKHSRIGAVMVLVIVLGDILVLGVVTALLFCYFSKKGSKLIESTEKLVYGGQNIAGTRYRANEEERGRMVFFQGAKRFELDDLLKASAEMLGKGNFGTSYKAILDSGDVVAVKRLKDGAANGSNRKEFEQHLEILGRVSNPNLVSFVAYYFSKEEKLLVSEYMPNGSLFWALHGNRGPGRLPVDWVTRLRIAAGAARGIAYIHESLKMVHGSIKSTNILLDKTGNARVSDYGLHMVALPMAGVKSDGYRAPEAAASDWRKTSQKADVYSFGVVLLEILTGKCPSWVPEGGSGSGFIDLPRWVQSVVREEWTAEVFDLELMRFKDIEEEMVALLQIATACTSTVPDQRPKMRHVARMIDELCGLQVSPSHDDSESSDGTSGAASQ